MENRKIRVSQKAPFQIQWNKVDMFKKSTYIHIFIFMCSTHSILSTIWKFDHEENFNDIRPYTDETTLQTLVTLCRLVKKKMDNIFCSHCAMYSVFLYEPKRHQSIMHL